MAKKISVSKGFSNNTFDTYVPELTDSANIQEAFELFYYGDSTAGNAYDTTDSLYTNIVGFNNRITSTEALMAGVTGGVVGTTNTQTLTNKTLTTPKINENVNLTATSTELNYVDGVTSPIQTQLDTIVNTTIPNSTPVGTIVMFGASASPVGWLLCDGGSTAGYAALAAVVGAFVPDLRGSAPIGYGTSADTTNVPTARTIIGATTGAETHKLITAEMPSHTHEGQFFFNPGATTGTGALEANGAFDPNRPSPGSAGGDQPHNNMQPSTVVNFIIKY